jgi:hypothetical protein
MTTGRDHRSMISCLWLDSRCARSQSIECVSHWHSAAGSNKVGQRHCDRRDSRHSLTLPLSASRPGSALLLGGCATLYFYPRSMDDGGRPSSPPPISRRPPPSSWAMRRLRRLPAGWCSKRQSPQRLDHSPVPSSDPSPWCSWLLDNERCGGRAAWRAVTVAT